MSNNMPPPRFTLQIADHLKLEATGALSIIVAGLLAAGLIGAVLAHLILAG